MSFRALSFFFFQKRFESRFMHLYIELLYIYNLFQNNTLSYLMIFLYDFLLQKFSHHKSTWIKKWTCMYPLPSFNNYQYFANLVCAIHPSSHLKYCLFLADSFQRNSQTSYQYINSPLNIYYVSLIDKNFQDRKSVV